MLYHTQFPSPVGVLTLAGDEVAIVGLWIQGQKYFGGGISEMEPGETPALTAAKDWLEDYFSGGRPDPSRLTLAPRGSSFARLVWRCLTEIPYGSVTTYGAIARAVARQLGRDTMSPQAVGGAVGHNPISILIPCHRVVGADGSLTGYAGGIGRKRWLLEHEGADLSHLFVPHRGSTL